ncbi:MULTISPECIES: FxDxF family PEP-CTERM protein [unclassified Methylophilus]|uniref:FxDxF family PEP-CTERM protein n=1 Tax=unclassified Methylophilus TaxID=2630143 RepID=UPI0006F1E0B8|nr:MULTISPECIES: FxDxF family PEP-CTERM protein [unclassified Methylophilus]KQT34487.1 hypothetical protein ASG24_12325 [Methylophilus sp. Leaf414]
MLNIKKSLAVMAFGSAMLLPMTSSATVTNFNDITDSSNSGSFSTWVVAGAVIDAGDTFNFSFTKTSDLSINISELFGLSIGNTYFSLKQGATEIQQIALAPLALVSSHTYTFDDLTSGSYSLTLVPSSIFTLRLGGEVAISAASVTPVPEPETNALMFLGLGIIGMIARRKFA